MKTKSLKEWLTWATNRINRSYAFKKAPAGYSFNATTTTRQLASTITTHGRPVLIMCSGDLNTDSGQTGSWFTIQFLRGSTAISSQTCQSTGASVNVPFCMVYLDAVAAGTYTYTVKFVRGAGNFSLTESGAAESPNFVVVEI